MRNESHAKKISDINCIKQKQTGKGSLKFKSSTCTFSPSFRKSFEISIPA